MTRHVFFIIAIVFMLTVGGCTPPQPSTISHAQRFEQRLKLKNSLLAVKNLSDQWDSKQKANLIKLIKPIAKDYEVSELRILANETLVALEE